MGVIFGKLQFEDGELSKIIWKEATPDAFDGPPLAMITFDEPAMWATGFDPHNLKKIIMDTHTITLGAYLQMCRDEMMELTGYNEETSKVSIEGNIDYYQDCWREGTEPIEAVREDISNWDD